jgi:hypothetical protein
VAQDHNDIYSIVERLAILEGRITPTTVKHGLNAQQRSVPQMPALFKPKTQKILGGNPDAKNPMSGYMVGDDVENDKTPVEEDVLDQVKSSLVDYLKSVEDKYKDSNLKDKVKVDRDLGKKDPTDRALIAKEKKQELDEYHQPLEVGDRIMVTAPNHYQGESGEIAEFSPSGKFVVVKFNNGDEASMHVSDVEFQDDQEEDDWYDDEEVDEDSEVAAALSGIIPAQQPAGEPGVSIKESSAVKTVTTEYGLFEIHGNEPSGFEIRHGNRAMKSRFKTIEEAETALEMFAARRAKKDDSADYIEEA